MGPNLHREIWEAYRPYARILAVDFLVAATVWGLLALFKWITTFVPVREAAGAWIRIIHSAGVLGVFGVLAASLVWDIIRLKRAALEP